MQQSLMWHYKMTEVKWDHVIPQNYFIIVFKESELTNIKNNIVQTNGLAAKNFINIITSLYLGKI
jgi:hypothetical protein